MQRIDDRIMPRRGPTGGQTDLDYLRSLLARKNAGAGSWFRVVLREIVRQGEQLERIERLLKEQDDKR